MILLTSFHFFTMKIYYINKVSIKVMTRKKKLVTADPRASDSLISS